MGIWYEALMRWLGPATKVMAMTKVCVSQRRDANGIPRAVSIPDHVDVLCEMACGAQAHLTVSSVTGLAPSTDVWLFGSEGTLHYAPEGLKGGRRGDKQLQDIPVPSDKQSTWRVEEEFVNAIRGKEKVVLTSFEDGVRYMEFTEAVTRSAQTGQAVSLPL
jgi:predicted dehydrogenase